MASKIRGERVQRRTQEQTTLPVAFEKTADQLARSVARRIPIFRSERPPTFIHPFISLTENHAFMLEGGYKGGEIHLFVDLNTILQAVESLPMYNRFPLNYFKRRIVDLYRRNLRIFIAQEEQGQSRARCEQSLQEIQESTSLNDMVGSVRTIVGGFCGHGAELDETKIPRLAYPFLQLVVFPVFQKSWLLSRIVQDSIEPGYIHERMHAWVLRVVQEEDFSGEERVAIGEAIQQSRGAIEVLYQQHIQRGLPNAGDNSERAQAHFRNFNNQIVHAIGANIPDDGLRMKYFFLTRLRGLGEDLARALVACMGENQDYGGEILPYYLDPWLFFSQGDTNVRRLTQLIHQRGLRDLPGILREEVNALKQEVRECYITNADMAGMLVNAERPMPTGPTYVEFPR